MAWPNPAHPGEPIDPNRPWHWVARVEDGGMAPLPIGWNAALRHWVVWDGSTVAPEEAARRYRYLGPCLTPAEAEAALAAAKASALPAGPPPPPEEPRGLAALAAAAVPPPPPAMIYRKDAVRMHVLIFAGTLAATLFLAEKIVRW
jgi:hypothetical protein